MTIDWWTLGLQTVNAIILVWILARFLFRPVSRIIAERQSAAHAALDDAEAARAEAQAARDAARAETKAIAAKRTSLIAKAHEDAEIEKRRLEDEGRAAADKVRAEGLSDLERQRDAQAHALEDQAGVLATDIVSRLLARLPEEARMAGFIDGLAGAVADLPATTRAGIGSDGPIRVRAARGLDAQEFSHLKDRMTEALGHTPDLEIETDPTLIAGLELIAPHAIVRNHFRADLDRIRTELTGHD